MAGAGSSAAGLGLPLLFSAISKAVGGLPTDDWVESVGEAGLGGGKGDGVRGESSSLGLLVL